MDLNGLGQGLVVASVALPRRVAALGTEAAAWEKVNGVGVTAGFQRARLRSTGLPVVLFVHQVVAGAESHQMGVVSWCRDGDRACAAHVRVAQLVGEDLQLIRREVVVVPEHMVMRGPAGSL